MRFLNKLSITVSVVVLSFFPHSIPLASAEMMKASGVVCWTGDIEFIRTTDKDMAWVWTVDWTYMPDDRNMLEDATSGKCLGSGGLIDGKPEISKEFCSHVRQDGGMFMSHGLSGPEGSQGTMYGGTGASEGIEGGFIGGARIQLPAEDGHITGCRPTTAEWTLKG